jgi:hypothetical protein
VQGGLQNSRQRWADFLGFEEFVHSFGQVVRKAYRGALHVNSVPPFGDIGVIGDYGDDGAEMADTLH